MVLEGFADVSVVLRAGVYALVKRGVVIYVGKSKSLYARLYAHRNVARRSAKGQTIPSWMPVKGFVFDEVFVRSCALEDLDRLEAEMIERYKPRFNQSLKSHGKITSPVVLNVLGSSITINAPPAPISRRSL